MPRISRSMYSNAAQRIFEQAGFECQFLKTCRFLVVRNDKKFFFDIAGKNLPYYGSRGQSAFPWETHVRPDRLDKILHDASIHRAIPCLGFCYWILDNVYSSNFFQTFIIGEDTFGLKLTTVENFRQHMQPRSESWGEVELPRKQVLDILTDPEYL